MEFREWLRRERKRLAMSRDALSKRAGISDTAIWLIETGRCKPRKITMRKIRTALHCMTNGDTIRAMINEELVFIIHCLRGQCSIPQQDRDCHQCKLDYLKQEAKGE